MVLENDCFILSQGFGDIVAFLLGQDHSFEGVVNGVVLVKCARVLCNNIDFSPQCAEGSAVQGMAMRSAEDVGTGFVYCRVDHVCSDIEQSVLTAIHDVSLRVDKDEIRFPYMGERHPEWIHPEMAR